MALTDHTGRTVVYTYDASGEHLLACTARRPDDAATPTAPAPVPPRSTPCCSVEYPDGTHEFFTYDARGRLGSIALDGNAERVTFTYDSAGRVTVDRRAGRNATQLFFDHQGLIAAVEDALGRPDRPGLRRRLNLTRVTDALGQNYTYAYDSRGNVIRTTDPLGQITTFTYTTDFNRLASVTDARGNPMHYGYDGRGNLTSITYADGSVEQFTSDALGKIDA